MYPNPVAREVLLPAYQLGRTIDYGRFFKRLESILIITWSTIGFMHLSTVFFFSAHVFKKTFNLKYYRPLLFPLGVICFSISIIPERLMDVISFEEKYDRELELDHFLRANYNLTHFCKYKKKKPVKRH